MKLTYKQQLATKEWADKRLEILSRDKFTCTKCGCKKKLQVHHKFYINGKKAWEYKNKALVTLCSECHKKEHNITTIEKPKIKVVRTSKRTPNLSKKQKEQRRIDKMLLSLSLKDKVTQERYNKSKSRLP